MNKAEEATEIRELTVEELPLLMDSMAALAGYHNSVAATFPGIYPGTSFDRQLQRAAEKGKAGEALLLAVYKGERIAGFAVAYLEGAKGIIENLYLDSSLRGRGLGRKLITRMLDFMKSNGVKVVDLHVVNGNPAREFYEKLGFQLRASVMAMKL